MSSPTTRRPLVLAAVMASSFMIALEATIVSTAMPQIVGQLGGLQLYSWVFSAFLLTQTATTVVFGKLADLIGRKTVITIGIGIFLVGSALCGFAWSMPSLIVFRLVQGVGAGAVLPVAMTIVGDLYTAHERAKIQGWLASVWAISAVIGPLAGGLIIQHLSWAWIFWINLPIGAAAVVGFWAYFHENRARGRGKIDHLSAAVFTVAIAAIMADLTALSASGRLEIGLTTLVAVVAVVLFILQERRSPEPMISLDLWGRRPIAAANAASVLTGMAMMGLTTFLPVFVQGVMQQSPLIAGFALSVMIFGWPVGATLGVRVFQRVGLRLVLRVGGLLVPAGSIIFLFLHAESSPIVAGLGSLIVGLGMGIFERLFDHPHSRDRQLVGARLRHGLIPVRPQSWQHVRRVAVWRRAEFRPHAFGRSCGRDIFGRYSPPFGAQRRRGGRFDASRGARAIAASDLRLDVRDRAVRCGGRGGRAQGHVRGARGPGGVTGSGRALRPLVSDGDGERHRQAERGR